MYRVRKTQLQVRETFSIKSLNGLNKMTCQVIIMYGTLTFCCSMAPLIISHHIFVNVWRQRRRQCHNRPNINHIDMPVCMVCVWIYSTNNTSEMIVSQLLGSGCRLYVGYTHFLKAIHPEFPCYSVNIKLLLNSYNGQAPKAKQNYPHSQSNGRESCVLTYI